MLSNITSNHKTESKLAPGDRVYLYGDPNYTGSVIRPIERTYPPKWSVQLDSGSYEAVNVRDISLLESLSSNPDSLEDENKELPFDDVPEPNYAQLQRELAALKRQNALLQQENEAVKKTSTTPNKSSVEQKISRH